jgi:hypothetical protein
MTVTTTSALYALAASTRRLREAARELELIAVEDRPRRGDLHLVDVVQNAAFEVTGAAEHVVSALRTTGSTAGAHPLAVANCQHHVTALGAVLVRDLAAPHRLAELGVLGRRHGPEAGAWAGEVVRCVAACQRALWTDVQPALVAYWREIAETYRPPPVTVPVAEADRGEQP